MYTDKEILELLPPSKGLHLDDRWGSTQLERLANWLNGSKSWHSRLDSHDYALTGKLWYNTPAPHYAASSPTDKASYIMNVYKRHSISDKTKLKLKKYFNIVI